MNQILEKVFETKQFIKSDGTTVTVAGETGKQQCEYLQKIIRDNHFKDSLEIGFAWGMSTLAITEEIVKNGGKHLEIDKFQFSMVGGGLT